MAIFDEKIEIRERCKVVHCVDLGEIFATSIYLQKSASIQPRTSPSQFGEKYSILFTGVLRPDETWGETVMAFVVLNAAGAGKWAGREGDFEAELIASCRRSLAGFKLPRVVRILDPAEGLPKNSTGKILKHLLRSRAKEEVETMRGDKT